MAMIKRAGNRDFLRGYFFAVAAILHGEGLVTATGKAMFESGGDGWTEADPRDIAVFVKYGLVTVPENATDGLHLTSSKPSA